LEGTVIIVAYNAEDCIGNCLTALRAVEDYSSIKVVVVDNASADRGIEIVREFFPEVTLIESGSNGGFATGNNRGGQEAEGDWIFLLNPDAEIKPAALRILARYLREHPEAGIVAPAIIGSKDEPAVSFFCFTTPLYSVFSALGLQRLFPINRIDGRWVLARQLPKAPVEVDRVLGAAMMIRREVWEQAGGMDEGFFLYSEEEDLCCRVRKLSWKVMYNPTAKVRHIGGSTALKDSALATASAAYSRDLYLRKHYSRLSAAVSRWTWIKMLALRWVLTHFTRAGVEARLGYKWAIKSLLRQGWFERELRPPRRPVEVQP